MTVHRCADVLMTGPERQKPCPHPAKVERDGVWRCGHHDRAWLAMQRRAAAREALAKAEAN
jgi:hypothetical protein